MATLSRHQGTPQRRPARGLVSRPQVRRNLEPRVDLRMARDGVPSPRREGVYEEHDHGSDDECTDCHGRDCHSPKAASTAPAVFHSLTVDDVDRRLVSSSHIAIAASSHILPPWLLVLVIVGQPRPQSDPRTSIGPAATLGNHYTTLSAKAANGQCRMAMRPTAGWDDAGGAMPVQVPSVAWRGKSVAGCTRRRPGRSRGIDATGSLARKRILCRAEAAPDGVAEAAAGG